MSGLCCGGSSKSEPNKIAATMAPPAAQPTAEQQFANSPKSESNDKPAKSEKSGCCCG